MAEESQKRPKNITGNVTGRTGSQDTTDTRNKPSQKDKTEVPSEKDTQE